MSAGRGLLPTVGSRRFVEPTRHRRRLCEVQLSIGVARELFCGVWMIVKP